MIFKPSDVNRLMDKNKEVDKEKRPWHKELWHFLWNSNSILSWIVDIILMFLIVKFIIFPLMSLALATSLPFVIIESGSMEHQGDFDQWFSLHGSWYLEHNITEPEIVAWKWSDGLDKGDIIIVKGLKNYNYSMGDVIIFKVENQNTPIIHRIIEIKEENNTIMFSTKGDHNDGQLPYEHDIQKEQIIGKAIMRIPKLGWVKLFFVDLFR